jgi:glutaconate CoA-transferase subunit A
MSKAGGASKLAAGPLALTRWLKDGQTLGIGGFGLDRKPMALVAAIAASPVCDLAIETYAGGFDIEVLLAAGKVRRVSSCHVGLDHFGLAPLFRASRESGRIIFEEWSELSQLQAWRAAADDVAYAAVAMDPRSDLLKVNPSLRLAASPFDSSDVVLARAPQIDLAILHAEAAHPDGWAVAVGDPYLDTILARAAGTVVVSAERLMDDAELERRHRDVHLLASYVDAVFVAPHGALPGSCLPTYMIDLPPIRAYCEASAAGKASPADLIHAVLAHLPALPSRPAREP